MPFQDLAGLDSARPGFRESNPGYPRQSSLLWVRRQSLYEDRIFPIRGLPNRPQA